MSSDDRFDTLTRTRSTLVLPADLKPWQRWAVRILVLVLLLALAAAWLHQPVLTWFVAKKISSQTGLKAELESATLAPRRGAVDLKGLVLHNPPGFGPEPLLRLAELSVELDPKAFRRGELSFQRIRFDLAELNLVTLSNGQNNLEALQNLNGGKKDTNAPASSDREANWVFKGIDKLEISLGKVRSIHRGSTNVTSEIDLRIYNQVFTNLYNQEQVAAALVEVLLLRGGDFSQGPIDELLRHQSTLGVTNREPVKSSP